MRPLVAIDLARSLASATELTPRGLDRVEYLYAQHFLQTWKGEALVVLPTPWGLRIVERERATKALSALEETWREHRSPENDKIFVQLKLRLKGSGGMIEPERPHFERLRQLASMGLKRALTFGRPASEALTGKCIFLSVGQMSPAQRHVMTWLKQRPNVLPVFMLHDAIPLEFPEYVTAGEITAHQRMIELTAACAKGLIVSTAVARASIVNRLSNCGLHDIPTLTLGLPVASQFENPGHVDPCLQQLSYMLVCGALEPRKNYLFLLEVWRELVRRHGPAAPRLVIVGRAHPRSRERQAIELSRSLREVVLGVTGLSTPSLVRLMRGARALLMPSLAEGFGLPIAEALTVGCPVIASDLPAHREAGGKYATYVSPIDGEGWLKAIEGIIQSPPTTIVNAFKPISRDAYFAAVESFLGSVAAAN